MKMLYLSAALVFSSLTFAQQLQKSPDSFRTLKAYEAMVYDTYQEAMPLEKLPDAYKKVLTQMGLTEDDVLFYTAVRMDRFVEKIGNCVVILRPNFFLYLTEEEQAIHIAVQLSRIKEKDMTEIPRHNENLKKLSFVKKASLGAAALILAGLYRHELMDGARYSIDRIEEYGPLLNSPAGIVIGAYAIINGLAYAWYRRANIENQTKHELATIDALGSEPLIKIRERQVVWGKNNVSWLKYQSYKLLAKLGLYEMPEVQLDIYREHLAMKKT